MKPEFKISPLNEVCSDIIDCVNKTAPVVDFETPYKMLRTTNVKKGYVDVASVRYVTKETFDKWTRRTRPKRNDIILTREAPLGEVGLLRSDDNVFLGQRLIQYRAKEEIVDQLYLYYAFQDSFMQGQILSYGSGATVEHLRIADCETIKVKYPNLPTQKKIASILSAYDDLIENNNQRIQLLEEMAEEIYKEWFVRMRFPGYKDCKFFDQDGKEVPHGIPGALPEGWVETRLGEVCEIQMGQSPKSEFYNEDMIGLPFHQGVTNFKSRFPSHKTYCTDPKRIAEYSDILLSVRAPVGRINIANTRLIIGRGLSSIRHKKDQQNYLYYLLKDVFKQEDSFGNGAVFNAVSKTDLEKIKVIRSKDSIETKFQELIKPFDDEINVLTNKNQVLQETRDLLLPRLISGKLDVSKLAVNEPKNLSMAAEPEGTYQMDNRIDAW